MDILKISNSCINCDNLNHELKRCGIHEVEVSEKYTCAEFRTDSAQPSKITQFYKLLKSFIKSSFFIQYNHINFIIKSCDKWSKFQTIDLQNVNQINQEKNLRL